MNWDVLKKQMSTVNSEGNSGHSERDTPCGLFCYVSCTNINCAVNCASGECDLSCTRTECSSGCFLGCTDGECSSGCASGCSSMMSA